MMKLSLVLTGAALALAAGSALAANTGSLLGILLPPSQAGPLKLVTFDPDLRPEFDLVTGVASPLGGNVGFDQDLEHVIVPYSWGSWSHDYEGDAYALGTASFELVISLPAGTGAFAFYAEPATFIFESFSVQETNSAELLESIEGDGGAAGFLFKSGANSELNQITIRSSAPFAVGEFSIAAVPEGSTHSAAVTLAGLAGLLTWRRRRVA